jgi:hypothetical protein
MTLDVCPKCNNLSLETTFYDSDIYAQPPWKSVNQKDQCWNERCMAWRISNLNNGEWFGLNDKLSRKSAFTS